ncbi:MAG TPA: hypothetical protein VHU81_09100 [Thermoanaerobaculia bacterium]|jgi:hypothetical protein|nr:hypothetical protein [Thermoanaerobaculia bacterium]
MPPVRTLLLLALALAASSPVPGQTAVATAPAPAPEHREVQVQLDMERKLLALDLVSYREARTRERSIRTEAQQTSDRMDQALQGSSLALGALEKLHDELVADQAAAVIASQRVELQLQRLEDRLRRIAFLEGEAGGRTAADPVSGRWQVQILPQNATAVFDLRLDGTVVAGQYRIAGGTSGSFRGTYSSNRLRLERIDARGGFDATFEGTVDPAARRIRGTWTTNELASGQPTRGDWSGVRTGDTPDNSEDEP